jgi:hypothetical protein
MTVIRAVPLASLKRDWSIYPRHDVDGTNTSDLARAIRGGHHLPPPLVQRMAVDTWRLVDGWHRADAWTRVLGPAGEIEVEEREFATEREVVEEAIRRNLHGRKLDQIDRTQAIMRLERLGADSVEIAATLHTTQERVEQLRVRVVIVDNGDGGGGERRAVKAILWPNNPDEPRRVTRQQYETQRSSQGVRPAQIIRQLTREIRDEVVDLNDPALCELLWSLHAMIGEKVPQWERTRT